MPGLSLAPSSLTLIVLFCLSIVCSLLSAQIIDLLAPGFQKDKAELASQMLLMMLFATPFIGLGTLTVGVQNARKSFFAPSVAPAFGALGNLIVLLAFYKVIGSVTLAWGFLASTIIIACFTATPLLLHGWTKTFPRVLTLSAPAELAVRPEVVRLPRLMLRPRRTGIYAGLIPTRQGGAGLAFFGVCEYKSGDDLRHINWRLSARHTQTLFTNEFQQERATDIGLILDVRRRSQAVTGVAGSPSQTTSAFNSTCWSTQTTGRRGIRGSLASPASLASLWW